MTPPPLPQDLVCGLRNRQVIQDYVRAASGPMPPWLAVETQAQPHDYTELRCRKDGACGAGGVGVQRPEGGGGLADDDALCEVADAPEELGQAARGPEALQHAAHSTRQLLRRFHSMRHLLQGQMKRGRQHRV